MIAIFLALLVSDLIPVERVVSVVGDEQILHSDVLDALYDAGYDSVELNDAVSDSYYIAALEQLINEKLLVITARNLGLYPSAQELQLLIDERIDAMHQMFSTDEYYNVYLAENGINEDELSLTYENAIKAELSNPEYIPVYLASIGMTMHEYRNYLSVVLGDRQAAEIYISRKMQIALMNTPMHPGSYLNANADIVEEYVMPRHIGWIYIPVLPTGSDADEARLLLLELRERMESGESFSELALEYSDDMTASDGGNLGSFNRGDMTPTFETAAFSLAIDEISNPVFTPFGVHLIQVTSDDGSGTLEARHILIRLEIDEADIMQAMETATVISDSLLMNVSDGLTFEDAAHRYSADPTTAPCGGDMGTIPLLLWLTPIAEAVDSMRPGETSSPLMLPEAGAVAIIRLYEDTGDVDWDGYSAYELNGLVQQVMYEMEIESLLDSLKAEIPIFYNLEMDDDIED